MSSIEKFSGICSDFVSINTLREETIYEKCYLLVNRQLPKHRLADSFEEWDLTSPNKLKSVFSEKEITSIHSILQHYIILHYGPSDLSECFKLLNVSSVIEILNPKNALFSNLRDLFFIPQNCSKDYSMMLTTLEAYTKIQLNPQKIAKKFASASFMWEYSRLLGNIYKPLEVLSLQERCRITFFIVASLFSINQYDSSTCILVQTDSFAKEFSPEMSHALRKIHFCLSKMKPESLTEQKTPEVPLLFRFAKPNIASLPNCIPHAANSCYMASTLTPLAYVCDQNIQESLKKFEFMEPTAARKAFIDFYSSLKAEAITDISVAQVDNLRTELQKAYDYRFFNPNRPTQEDAGDFLMCITEDLLQMNTGCCFYEKHTFQLLETSVKIEPENYNYDEALATKQSKLIQNMTEISLENAAPGVKFADLVTGIRHTNDIDLNAYRRPTIETGPKFQTIMAHHQEQFMVESAEKAPNFFCARLRRFLQNPQTGARTKHRIPVEPSLKLQFQIKDSEESNNKVTYELAAVTVHSGIDADGGHYYCYLRDHDRIYKYNDFTGAEVVSNEAQVWQDVLTDGYIFFYKKVSNDTQ